MMRIGGATKFLTALIATKGIKQITDTTIAGSNPGPVGRKREEDKYRRSTHNYLSILIHRVIWRNLSLLSSLIDRRVRRNVFLLQYHEGGRQKQVQSHKTLVDLAFACVRRGWANSFRYLILIFMSNLYTFDYHFTYLLSVISAKRVQTTQRRGVDDSPNGMRNHFGWLNSRETFEVHQFVKLQRTHPLFCHNDLDQTMD
jgi:hypothetical protein